MRAYRILLLDFDVGSTLLVRSVLPLESPLLQRFTMTCLGWLSAIVASELGAKAAVSKIAHMKPVGSLTKPTVSARSGPQVLHLNQ